MTQLGDIADKVRSKNAGPFWLTVDIFCGSKQAYEQINAGLPTTRVARLFKADPDTIKRFNIPSLNVVKFSLPRPQIQGSVADRDMHGASWGPLVAEIDFS